MVLLHVTRKLLTTRDLLHFPYSPRTPLYYVQGHHESTDALMSQQGQLSIKLCTYLFPMSKLISCGQFASELMQQFSTGVLQEF